MAWHFFNFFLLHLSMLMVVMLREGISFLVFWELMSVSTFFLIIFESEKQEIKEAGIKFLIQMHIALAFLLAGFLVSSTITGQGFGFESLAAYFGTFPVFPVSRFQAVLFPLSRFQWKTGNSEILDLM